MIDIQIRGAEEMAVLTRRLKDAGDAGKDLRKELLKGLNRAAKPAKAAIKPNVLAKMPKRGGLAEFLSSSTQVRQSNRGDARNPGVTIRSRSTHAIGQIDQGIVRHPIFGNRKVWASQAVPAGAFTDPIKERAPEMRIEMERTIRAIAAKLERPL